MSISITKVFVFEAAHSLYEYCGNCKNLHGHSYKLETTFTGEINKNGMIEDFNEIKNLVNSVIVEKLDHTHLNEIFDFNPTCENLLLWIWNEVKSNIKSDKYCLSKIILWETATSYSTMEI